MKSRKMLLVTIAYPYGQGESFVRAELEHISQYFDVELVPCYYTPDVAPRQVRHKVNLDYAAKRWGLFRTVHLAASFAKALWKYKWLGDAVRILTHQHRYANMKELARALYRAEMFEGFLRSQVGKSEQPIDLVYFYWMVPEIMGAIGLRDRARAPLKIVSRAHGGDLYEDRKAGGYAGLRDSIIAGIDEIYCISDHGKFYLQGRYPWMAGKFHTARLGVDDPGYLNAQPGGDQLSIVSCSFMVPGKRLHLIIEAIAYLLERDPSLKIKWTHIGDGELFDRIRALVRDRLGNRAEVVFTGYLTQAQLMDLYRLESFDVVANVSDCEGIPVSLMEASSTGIPIVATDVGANSEIVNARNGILIPADADIQTIASALVRFTDRRSAAAYRKNARSYWQERFNAHTNYKVFGRELVEILERPAKVA